MRFAVAHKTASYLMVGFAYLAMTTGGGVSGGIALAGLVALIASWWWEPPRIRFEKWSWVWTTASVLALAYAALTAILTGDFLGVGAQFLIWLIVAKGFNRRAAKDWQQMYLLSFLMLVAGSVLNPELTYGLCFLGFVIASTWAMTLFHLRREMEDNLLVKHAADRASERVEVRRILDSRRIVSGKFFLGTGLLSFGVFLAAAAIFLALPRVGIGFFLKTRGGMTLAGFSDGVKLGGHGVIKTDSTVVMRVEMEARYGGRGAEAIHWRGVAFDLYSKGEWSRSRAAPSTQAYSLDPVNGRDARYFRYDEAPVDKDLIEGLRPTLVKQNIYLEPLDSNVLFGASLPRIIEYAPNSKSRSTPQKNDEIRYPHASGTLSYTIYSQLAKPSEDALRTAPATGLPKGYDVYLQLPPEITPRTRALAQQITAPHANAYDKARAIEAWLESNLTYTLRLEDPGAQEAVDFFLFDRKQGHCEYFASAFAVLARAAGIPVRQVNGFLGGEWNEYQGYVAVRAGDAHSWDEVYFPGVGWVTFDPTPSANIDQLGRGGGGWRDRLSRMIDTLRFQWTKWVIEYDLASQLELFKSIGGAIKSAALAVKGAAVAAKDAALSRWPILAGIGALVAGFVLLRRRRATAPSQGRASRTRARSTVAEVYFAVARSLTKSGIPRDAATTPRELATRLTAQGSPIAADLTELTELYYAAEWGAVRDPAAEDRASALAVRIRETLAAKRSA